MAAICSIPNCEKKSPEVKLFKIPTSISLRRAWLLSIKQYHPNYCMPENKSEQYVCSEHFKDQHFILPEKEILKNFAIPTVFMGGSYIYVDIYGLLCPSTNTSEVDMTVIDYDNNNIKNISSQQTRKRKRHDD
uniref:THAP-type domain-containing protein n=1 Tax=Schizaphis graminum TaxID=13262 RepID=A0A2S2P8Z7_SCHGA